MVNPSRDVYKTKSDVMNLIQQAVADGANLIQQQGDAGLDKTTKFPFGNRLVHNSLQLDVPHSGQRRALRPARGVLSRQQYGAAGIAAAIRPPNASRLKS